MVHKIAKTEEQNAVRDKQSASSIDLEPDINLEREFDGVRKKRYLEQQCRASRGRHKEDIQQEKAQKEDVQKESVRQEQKCYNQYKQECNTVQVIRTSLIPEQKCQDVPKQKYQTK